MVYRLPLEERSDAAPAGAKGKLSAKQTDEVRNEEYNQILMCLKNFRNKRALMR
jgi:hypothetical protein